MIGRNDKCLCGSGLKFKKCCLKRESAKSLPSKNKILSLVRPRVAVNELSFSGLISTAYGEELPFLPLPGKKDLIRMALKYLDQNALEDACVQAELDGCLSVRLLFDDTEWEDDDENDSIDDEDDDYYHPRHFDYGPNEIEVFLTESTPGGRLQIEVFCNEQPQPTAGCALQVNAALTFLWLTLSNKADRRKISVHAEKLYLSFQELFKNQKKIDTEIAQISDQLKGISLSTVCLSVEPILADEKRIDTAMAPFRLPDPLPARKAPKNKLLFTEASIRRQRKSGLPSLFFKDDEKQKSSWPEDDTSQRLSEMVSYYFSDGTVISAQKILTTKYALLLPPDLLPGRFAWPNSQAWSSAQFAPINVSDKDQAVIHDEITMVTTHRRHAYFQDPPTLKTRQVMAHLIAGLTQRLSRKEIQLDLKWAGEDVTTGLRLSQLELKAQPFFQWRTGFFTTPLTNDSRFVKIGGRFDLEKRKGLPGEMIPLKCGFLNLETKTFCFHNVPKDVQVWNNIRYSPYSIECQIETEPRLQVCFSATGQENIQELRRSLNLMKAKKSDESETLNEAHAVTAKPELHFDSSGRFLLIRHLAPPPSDANPDAPTATPLEYPILKGFSSSSIRLFKLLGGGLPAYFEVEARNLASASSKRDFELKLLKHFGVANLFIFETLSVHLHGTLSDGTLVQKSAEILPFLETKILSLLGDPLGPPLSERCSKQVYAKLKSFAVQLRLLILKGDDQNKTADTLILPEGEMQVRGLFESELRLIFTVLTHAAVSSNGEIFTKSRLNLFDQIFPYDEGRVKEIGFLISRERLGLETLQPGAASFQLPYAKSGSGLLAILGAFRTLLNSGFEFYLRGQKIEELRASEFRTEMTLADAKAEKINAPGAQTINWFELNPQFFLYGQEIPRAQVGQLLQEGIVEHAGKFFLVPANRLPSLKRLSNFWERLQRGKKSGGALALGQQVYQVPKSQILEMLALRSSGIPVLGGARWKQICDFYDRLDAHKPALTLPKTINAELKPYQKLGVQWLYELYRLGLGAVLADDMGLGKTLQTLAFLEKLRDEKNMGPVLIVVPTSLTYNWLSEKEKFTPKLPMRAFSAKLKDEISKFVTTHSEAIVLTTYGLMHEHKEYFQQFNWNIIIFDEAQNLKTITTQRTTTARGLQSQIKICLTGTPLENHLGEFYSILDLAVPGCLGDVDEFRKVFVNTASIEADDLRFLKLKSKPLILRRTKQQILSELPEKTESRVALDFEDKQKKIYRDIAISYNQKIQEAITVQGESKCQLQMLTALLRLRQACSDPSALPGVTYARTPPKLEALKESLLEIVESGESALVFTQFLRTLERTEALSKEAGLPTFTIHGGLSQSNRQKVLREFNDCAGGAVLIMTLKTGGVGLNLAKASYVFHLEPWWNPAVENQATDRAHRMGQRRAVQVYRYIMHESVEEKIELLKQRKQLTFSALFSDHEILDTGSASQARIDSAGSFLSKDDFNFLLSLN